MSWHSAPGLAFGFEDFPVHNGEFLEQGFEFLMTTCHSPNLIDHGCADVFGSCSAVFLERQREAPSWSLRGDRSCEEIEIGVDFTSHAFLLLLQVISSHRHGFQTNSTGVYIRLFVMF